MPVGQICTRIVATAAPGECVRVAARRMAVNDVGTLVVVADADPSQAIGIVTDRDIALRCVAGELDPDVAHVSQVMTHPVETMDESVSIDDAMTRMATLGLRRLVITGDGHKLVGILTLDDVLDHLMRELQPIGRLLDKQQPRIPA
jgi:signal-transduction protein with cAMP-binding, CBS, and nucleotidyltransferase domain